MLIAKYNTYVMPVVNQYSIHVHDHKATLSNDKRNSLFQKTHAIYFGKYIKQTLDEAIRVDSHYFND